MWTEERVEMLKTLWEAGESAATIAREVGGDMTRNAVIGKVHRLGLTGRKQKVVATKSPARKRNGIFLIGMGPAVWKPLTKEPVDAAALAKVPRTAKDLIDLRVGECHWPFGDGPFLFCGHTTLPGFPYCAGHARRAHSAPRVRVR